MGWMSADPRCISLPLIPEKASSTDLMSTSVKPCLRFADFCILGRIGAGDISTVYLCCHAADYCKINSDDDCWKRLYAMKVVDKQGLVEKNKQRRADTERNILKMLDHPFLPHLHAEFELSRFSCAVTEYCPGGDLHAIRHKQPNGRFSIASARFYAAEVVVALEYLHLLGIVYRDLKPENVLIRSDGHVMLSDFDLSLLSHSVPALRSPVFRNPDDGNGKTTNRKDFFRRFFSRKVRVLNTEKAFVAEPVLARSCSCVGTHEYVAPEIASGGSHGSAVDWWALGIFIYELIYGRSPFVAPTNKQTLCNILKDQVSFPSKVKSSSSQLEPQARDLITRLLVKDPEHRLGSKQGSAEIKNHPFFKGISFALIRTLTPPHVPDMPFLSRRRKPLELRTVKSARFDYF